MKVKALSILILISTVSTSAWASKFDAMLGMFAINAKANNETASVSGLGSYKLQFNKSVLDQFDMFIGYTVNMANTIGGDLGYGLDIGANYFPFSFTEPSEYDRGSWSARRDELWRPYVGMSFNQRNFQSVRNGYAGFGFNAGTEYAISKQYSLKGELRYISLAGSNDSTATETNILVGISLKI